jgi:hypothetical protein
LKCSHADNFRNNRVQQNNHNVHALRGVIALRQASQDLPGFGNLEGLFTAAIAHADALLAQTPELFDALDAKGLALCGLAVCDARNPISARNRVSEAIAAFRAARAINKDAGVVARVVRLVDALALAVPNGAEVLAEARRAAGGGKE